MSTHSKRRMPNHVHGQREIVDTVPTSAVRPRPQPIQLRDIIVDGGFTLGTTIVQFTKYFEVTQDPMVKASATNEVDDATATGGKCVKRLSSAASGTMFYGPYITVGEGEYYAVFMLKVASNASSSNLITIDVNSATKGTTLATRILKPNEFNASGQWQKFALKFVAEANITDYEFRAMSFVTGITDLSADWIGIIPANVPLDSTGITNPNEDTNINPDLMPTGITNPSTSLSWSQLVDTGMGDEVNVVAGSGATLIKDTTVSPPAGSQPLVEILIKWQRGASGGSGRVQFLIYEVANIRHTWWEMVSAETPAGVHSVVLPLLFGSGTALALRGRCQASENVYVQGQIIVNQSPNHTHIPNDPTHDTTCNTGQGMETITHTHIPDDPQHEH